MYQVQYMKTLSTSMFYDGYNPNEHKVQMVQTDLNLYSLFLHVFPKVVDQTVSIEYGVFAIKYIEVWNCATLVESIAPVSPIIFSIYNFCHNRIKSPYIDCNFQSNLYWIHKTNKRTSSCSKYVHKVVLYTWDNNMYCWMVD